MRNFKFLATTLVALMLACVLAVASFAAVTPFTDVDDTKNETLSDAVSLLNGLGVAKGTSETKFGTMDHVTREQMAAFVYRLMKSGKSLEGGSNTTPFTDLTDSTYFGYVSWANGTGVIKGTSATTFNPKGGIMLQDAYTMVVRALGYEDDTYQYPYTYIDTAEELGLDEGLDSVVGYTTKLTRGDVAIILYNTFFAEMAKDETKQVERPLAGGKNWVLEKKTFHPTVAEDIYDVEVGNFTVRATPKFAFNDSEASTEFVPLCDEYDTDMLQLVASEEDEALQEIYCEFASTGLTGSADDYIMRGVEVFYTYEEKNGKKELDKVYFMNSAHKVLETSAATFEYKDEKDADAFYKYTRGTKKGQVSDYEKIKGHLTVGNETIYFFDAPYTYLKPTFSPDMSEDVREELKNEKNVKLVDIKCLDMEKGTYSYYIDSTKPVDNAEDMMANLVRIFSRGVYKLKFFDVDGDGIYEYAHYMPATYGFMDGDDGKYFSTAMEGNAPLKEKQKGSSVDLSFKPTIYYNDAKISGKDFQDGDMVLAYLNPAANMIDVMAVIKPYNGYASYVRTEHGMVKIDNTTFQSAYTYRIVENFDDGSSLYNTYHLISNSSHDFFTLPSFSSAETFPSLISQDGVGEIFDIYAYKTNGWSPVILWYDHVEDATISFGLDELAIPVSNEDDKSETLTKGKFDAKIGDTVYYAKVYFNGKVSYIPLDVEEMYPELDAGYSEGEYNLSEITGQNGFMAYVDKICKVKVNSDGLYTLVPLLHAEDEDGEYVGVSRDSTTLVEEDNNKQYGNDLDMEVVGFIKKVAGSRYELVDENGETLLGDPFDVNGETVKYFTMTASTRIVIKNTVSSNDNEVEYLEFDASSFKGSAVSELTNIQYILKGDPSSKTKADLVLLYAEATDFEFEVKGIKNGWRIVAGSEVAADENGDYRNFYKLFNPYTGAVEEDVPGEDSQEKARNLDEAVELGTIVEIKGGYVDEDGATLGAIDTSVSEGLVYLTEYNEEEGYIGFVPVEAVTNAMGGEILSGEDFNSFIESYVYYGDEYNFDGEEFKTTVNADDEPVYGTALYYTVTEDTVISVLKSDKAGADAIKKGEYTLADISAIAGSSKDYKCFNNKVLNRKGEYGTEYAKFVKAYVYTSENADDEDELPVAEYIIIVVNGGEEVLFSDYDDNFLPKTAE